MVKLTIRGNPITKKNSQKIVVVGRRRMIVPSDQYKQYESAAGWFIPSQPQPIDYPVNVKCVYFMQTRRRVDLVNLEEATLDILTKYGVLSDDNSNVVQSMDGSRVLYDKQNPRVEITIERV